MNAAQDKLRSVASDASPVWLVVMLAVAPCLVAGAFGSQHSHEPPCNVTTSRPALVFSEYLMDYGPAPISQRPTLTSEFYFRNNGSEKVQITGMQPSCGCLSPAINEKELEPGRIGKLTLPIRLNNEPSGFREYTVTVAYSDPKPRHVTLTVKAVLPEKSLIIEPRVLMVMGATKSEQQHIVTVSDYRPESADKPMRVTDVTGSSTLFTPELAGQFNREGANRISVGVQFHDNAPQGRHRGLINIATDDTMFPMIQIPVIVGDSQRHPTDSVRVSPEVGRIVFNTASPEESVGMTIAFDIPSRWNVTHCDTFPSGIVATYESILGTVPDHQSVRVQLSISELPQRGIEQAVLTLNATDGDASEMVTVPINLIWK
jgi:hypothetical protein